jgi:hypothetical protein
MMMSSAGASNSGRIDEASMCACNGSALQAIR